VLPTSGGKRISARSTFFMKRIFPALLFGLIALFFAVSAMNSGRGPAPPAPVFIVPLLLIVAGYFVMRRFVFDLADEVTDTGDALIIRFGSDEQRIELAEIINVSYAGLTNPRRITLTLRHPGRFGKEVSFSPQESFLTPLLSGKSPLVTDLIERVDAARRR